MVTTALLELVVRLAVLERRFRSHSPQRTGQSWASANKILRELEEDRGLSFYRLVDELETAGVIHIANAKRLKAVYTSTRIPLHHAVTGRFSRARADPGLIGLLDEIGLVDYRRAGHFEEAIEDHSLSEIEKCCELLESVRTKGAA